MERDRRENTHPSVAALGPFTTQTDTLHHTTKDHTSLEGHFILKTQQSRGLDPTHVCLMKELWQAHNSHEDTHTPTHTSHKTPQLELSAQGLPIPIWFCRDWLVPSTSWTMHDGSHISWGLAFPTARPV